MAFRTLCSCCLLLSLLQLCHIAVECHPPVPADIDCPMPERGDDDKDSNAVGAATQTFFRNPSDCSIFYQCSNGVPFKFHCPLGTLYDSTKNMCNWPDTFDCVEEPADEPVEEPAEKPAEEPVEKPVEEPAEEPAEERVEGSGGGRPAEESARGSGEQTREPADKPVDGLVESLEEPVEPKEPIEPVEKRKNPKELMEPIKRLKLSELMEPLELTGLVQPMEPVEPASEPEKPLEPASEPGKPLEPARTEEDNMCANVPSDVNKQFPHPADCRKYIRCIRQVAVEKVCPWARQYNPVREVCQFPRQAGCRVYY